MAHFPHGLTIGMVVSSKTIWRWQLQLIRSLIESGHIAVSEILVLNVGEPKLAKAVLKLHRWDSRIFNSPITAFELVDVSHISENTPIIKMSESLSFGTDLVINLSETIIPNSLLKKNNCRVLEPHFSEEGSLASQYLGISEYLKGEKQVYFSIVYYDASGACQVLDSARASLDRGSFSRNLNQYEPWVLAMWQRNCQSLPDTVKAEKVRTVDDVSLSTVKTAPLIKQLSGHVIEKLKQKYLHKEQWILLLKHLDSEASYPSSELSFAKYHELIPPEDCFWADPFVISRNERDYIFFEELPFAAERGHLSCMEVFPDGSHSEPKIIIQESHHLSYPHIFEYESEDYLIPESGDNGRIDVYQCTEFPFKWQHHKTLMDYIHAYDSTLVEYDGLWWLFATVAPELGLSGCQALHIFYADSPLSSDWQAHSANPVINDAARARPGGNFYTQDEKLFRVSQDCAGQYGAGVNINEVVRLDKEVYQEVLVSQYYPDWDPSLTALHTFNRNHNIAVADALRVSSRGMF